MIATDLTKSCRIITNNQSSEYITQGPITWSFVSPSRRNWTITYNNLSTKFGNIKNVFQNTFKSITGLLSIVFTY